MTQTMIEALTPDEYSFFLAHGVSNDAELSIIEFIDSLYTEEFIGNTITN